MKKKIGIMGLLLFCSLIAMPQQDGGEKKSGNPVRTEVINSSGSDGSYEGEIWRLNKEMAQLSSKWLWTSILGGLVFLCLISFSIYLHNKLKKVRGNIYKIKENLPANLQNSSVKVYEDKILSLERQVGRLSDDIYKMKNSAGQTAGTIPPPVSLAENSQVKYLKYKSGVYLSHELSNSTDSNYKIFDIHGNYAKFEFCGNEQEAIADKDAFFDSVCDDSNFSSNVNQVINVEPGAVELQGDGRWKVTKKATIKFQ